MIRTAALGLALCISVWAPGNLVGQADDTALAINQSKITTPGSLPFHLKAIVRDVDNKVSTHKAEIEEYWAAPDKWRRTISSPDFSQTLIVNGEAVSEQHTGDYYPFWLRNLVTALFDLRAEDFAQAATQVHPKASGDLLSVPMNQGSSGGGVVPSANLPYAGRLTSNCWRVETIAEGPGAKSKVRNEVCVQGDLRLLTLINTPTFHAQFRDYKPFKQKQVARSIVLNLDENTHIEAEVKELSELRAVEESLFAVGTAALKKLPESSVRVDEVEARKMALNPQEIAWNPVREGNTTGTLSLMIFTDKQGRVRETRPLHADNPFMLEQARQQVSEWRFQPLQREGAAVQMESLLTFSFKTVIQNPLPLLSNKEARKLATDKFDPTFTSNTVPKGEFMVRATVDEQGKVVGVLNVYHINEGLFSLASATLRSWHFKPYKVNGKPDRFNADIVFRVQ